MKLYTCEDDSGLFINEHHVIEKKSFSYKSEQGLLVVVTVEIKKYHPFEVPVN